MLGEKRGDSKIVNDLKVETLTLADLTRLTWVGKGNAGVGGRKGTGVISAGRFGCLSDGGPLLTPLFREGVPIV